MQGKVKIGVIQHDERLKSPLVRNDSGELVEASWDEALDRAAGGFMAAQKEHGDRAVYAIASGRAPVEASYAVQKFIRAGYGTNSLDNCSRH